MPDMFEMDKRALDHLEKVFNRMPRQAKKATADMINTFAFGSRIVALDTLQSKLFIRNKAFVARKGPRSRVRVDRADSRVPIDRQVAWMGSKKFKRFSGWEEQETGKKADRPRTPTIAARGGSIRKRVRGTFRANRLASAPRPEQFGNNADTMLQLLGRMNFRQPMIVTGHRKLRAGFWKFEGRRGSHPYRATHKIRLLQAFNKKPQTIKRNPWMAPSLKKYMATANRPRLWKEALRRVGIQGRVL